MSAYGVTVETAGRVDGPGEGIDVARGDQEAALVSDDLGQAAARVARDRGPAGDRLRRDEAVGLVPHRGDHGDRGAPHEPAELVLGQMARVGDVIGETRRDLPLEVGLVLDGSDQHQGVPARCAASIAW